jgi:hypothetical protein
MALPEEAAGRAVPPLQKNAEQDDPDGPPDATPPAGDHARRGAHLRIVK